MSSEKNAASPASPTRGPQSDALFRAAADQAPQVMWIVNAKGAVTYLNHCWYELVGGMPPQWLGHEWVETVHPDDVARMREQWKTSSATGSIFEGTRRVRAVDGRWHILSYKAVPVFDAGGLACWVGMDADVTELVEAQAALRAANEELQAFSNSISHDLRTPLLTARGFGQLLAQHLGVSADAKVRGYMQRIGGALEHMQGLLEGLLTLTQSSRASLVRQDVDLSAVAAESLAMLSRVDPRRSVAAMLEPDLMAWADKRLMAALMDNLIGNAWKFTGKTPHARIEVGKLAHPVKGTVFFVRDNGAGFDLAHATRLFTPFERLHDARDFPGTGIGLATVRRIVSRHGGEVWVESAPGQGTSFYFTLPPSQA